MTGPYAESVGETGPRVVLVHGSLSAGMVAWQCQLSLAERWRLVVIDRRGYGRSPACRYVDPDIDATDVVAFLGDAGAHLVGTSMGAMIALKAAAQAPQLVRSLVLIEPPALADHANESAVERTIGRLREAYRDSGKDDTRAFLSRFVEALEIALSVPVPLPEPLEQAVRMLRTERPWELVAPIDRVADSTYPKLVVSGDQVATFQRVCAMLARRLDAEHCVFPGAPHAVQRIDQPFNDCLERFLLAAEARLALRSSSS